MVSFSCVFLVTGHLQVSIGDARGVSQSLYTWHTLHPLYNRLNCGLYFSKLCHHAILHSKAYFVIFGSLVILPHSF